MTDVKLKTILKNRLKKRTNKKFIRLVNELCRPDGSVEGHHLLESFVGGKKQNDLLIAFIGEDFHREITYKREATEDEFIDMLINALENLFDVLEKLLEGR